MADFWLSQELSRLDIVPNLHTERGLLLLGGVFVWVSTLALASNPSHESTVGIWLIPAVWTLCAMIGSEVMNRWLPHHDPLIFPLILFLSGWGLVIVERLIPAFALRQVLWLALANAALLLVACLPQPLRWLRTYRYTLLFGGLALLVSTILLGSNPSDPTGELGAPQLWLGIAGFFFQPSELLKIVLVAFLASYLAEQYPIMRAEGLIDQPRFLSMSPRILGPILLMWGLTAVILVWQRDLGTAILFFVVFMLLLYLASGNAVILFSAAVLVVIAGIAAYFLFDVVQLRIDIWLNPWPEADGRAYQIVQSLMAFAAGGTFGQGIGQGAPGFIPVVHSDFVFAALAEEWGLLGVVVVVGVFAVLVMRAMRTATLQSGRPFNALLAVGLSLLLGVQALLIMGGVLRVLPLTGVTLPYLSYGGSSLVISFVLAGLLLRLSAENT